MEPETVNIPIDKPHPKLSKLQKLILSTLYEQTKEVHTWISKYKNWTSGHTLADTAQIWPINSKHLSWKIARKLERKTFLSNAEVKADHNLRKAKALDSISLISAPFAGGASRMWDDRGQRLRYRQLLPSFRASLSRSLKRLEDRELITLEKGEGTYWNSDNRKAKTTGVSLTTAGLVGAIQLSHLAKSVEQGLEDKR